MTFPVRKHVFHDFLPLAAQIRGRDPFALLGLGLDAPNCGIEGVGGATGEIRTLLVDEAPKFGSNRFDILKLVLRRLLGYRCGHDGQRLWRSGQKI